MGASARASDLVHGFSEVTTNISSTSGMSTTELAQAGLIAADERSFRIVSGAKFIQITSVILYHRLATSAHSAWQHAAAATSGRAGFTYIPTCSVGEYCFGDEGAVLNKSGQMTALDLLDYQRGRYLATLVGFGSQGTITAARLVPLAKIVDARIEHTH